MTLPDPATYKDLHTGLQLPNLPMNRITRYLDTEDQTFDEKIVEMYKERWEQYVRVAEMADKLYLTGCIWAEQTKSMSYKVDVSLDSHQVVQEAQCECSAGMGPTCHCKHAVFYMQFTHSPLKEVF